MLFNSVCDSRVSVSSAALALLSCPWGFAGRGKGSAESPPSLDLSPERLGDLSHQCPGRGGTQGHAGPAVGCAAAGEPAAPGPGGSGQVPKAGPHPNSSNNGPPHHPSLQQQGHVDSRDMCHW